MPFCGGASCNTGFSVPNISASVAAVFLKVRQECAIFLSGIKKGLA
jgi:hypothetical protein